MVNSDNDDGGSVRSVKSTVSSSDSSVSDSSVDSDIINRLKSVFPEMTEDNIIKLGKKSNRMVAKVKGKNKKEESKRVDNPQVINPAKKMKGVIPKHLVNNMLNVPKLTVRNFTLWDQMIRRYLIQVKGAIDHLDGKIKPGDKRYNVSLAIHIQSVLNDSCAWSGHDNVAHIIINTEPANLAMFYASIKTECSVSTDTSVAEVTGKIAKLNLEGFNVRKYCEELDKLIMIGKTIGRTYTDDEKIGILTIACKNIHTYSDKLEWISMTSKARSYEETKRFLYNAQDRIEARVPNRGTARVAELDGDIANGFMVNNYAANNYHATNYQRQEISNEERERLYNRGKKDPLKPGQQALCYNCGKPNHIAKNCRNVGNSQARYTEGNQRNSVHANQVISEVNKQSSVAHG